MAEERISWFPVLTDDELDEPERKLFAKAAQVIGFVPNVFRTYAWRPERFRAWFTHFKTVMEGTPGLSAREREMISVAVSMANGCLYCLVAHGAALRQQSDDKIEADLPPELQGLFRKAREKIGFVPNVFRTYAFRPERLSAWFAHFRLLHEETPGLSAAEREMIAVVVSMANGCLYCLVAHGAALREAWGDPVMADRITLDWRRADGLSDRQRAICAMAERLTLTPLECTEAELDELRGHGLSDTDAWDVIELAAMYNFTNRVALATGQMPNPEYHALAR